jgi:hypothetical protein
MTDQGKGLASGAGGPERRPPPRPKSGRRAIVGASEALSTAALAVTFVATWPLLINHFGLVGGLLLGWVIAPVAGCAAAAVVLVWTVPLRPVDVLSLRRRPLREALDTNYNAEPVKISAVVPAYNAVHHLKQSLPPLVAMKERGELAEIILVDDGSTDGSAMFAASQGLRVVSSGGRKGPAGARNVASKQAVGDVLWFVDADVVVHDDAARVVRDAFRAEKVTAVFGSYDDKPPADNFGSQYKNLVHHHYHQHADPVASTFWSGCGAIRKDAFIAAGGFDAETYPFPSIEDIDLGYRLRRNGGEIRLVHELLSTHLKVWSIAGLVHTDIFRRALPWARLLVTREGLLDDLNVGSFERLRAAVAGIAVLAICGSIVGLVPPLLLGAILLTVVTANWHLAALFVRRRGLVFGLAGLAFHQIYYIYSTACFLWCWLEARLWGRKAKAAAVVA